MNTTLQKISVFALNGIPIINPGDDLGAVVLSALEKNNARLADGDVLVVAQKIVSKAEGAIINLSSVEPSVEAISIASRCNKDPRYVELVLRQSNQVLRVAPGHLIVEQRLGFICANAGIDRSNVAGQEDTITTLPHDPDGSARRIRDSIRAATGRQVAVIVSDTHGRAFRNGAIGVAIGVAGIVPVWNKIGQRDLCGRELQSTTVATADELASAASLIMGHGDEGTPVVIIRGATFLAGEGSGRELVRPREKDLFR